MLSRGAPGACRPFGALGRAAVAKTALTSALTVGLMVALTAAVLSASPVFGQAAPPLGEDAASAAGRSQPAGLRVIGGVVSDQGAWPYQISIATVAEDGKGYGACGGTLIHPEWVLTAAHCVVDEKGRVAPPSRVKAQLGYNERIFSPGERLVTDVTRIIPHPEYLTHRQTLRSDIALLRLAEPSDLPRVRLSHGRVAPEIERNRGPVTLLGWGRTDDVNRKASDVLKEARLQLVDSPDCARKWGPRYRDFITDRQICATARADGASCQGDSGGPILHRGPDGNHYQVGIVSFGGKRCVSSNPTVYTRVSRYIPWIQSHVNVATLDFGERDPFEPARDRALIIGVDDYREDEFDLKGSVEDTRLMYELYRDTFGLDPENIKVLTDADATRDGILSALRDWLMADGDPGARLFLHFSGHGYHQRDQDGDEDDGFDEVLLPHDAAHSPLGGIANVIVDDELREIFALARGRKVVATIDSCHSGTMTRSVSPRGRADFVRMPTRGGLGRAMPILPQSTRSAKMSSAFEPISGDVITWTATSPSQLAVVDLKAQTFRGVFTSRFVEGLRSKAADADHDEIVTAAELLDYVGQQSKRYCERNAEQCVTPVTPSLSGPDDYYTANVITGRAPPKPVNVCDGLVAGNEAGVRIEIEPSVERRVGDRIRFRVTTRSGGDFILFEIGPTGDVAMLLPNEAASIDRYRLAGGGEQIVPDSVELGYAWFETAPPVGRYRLYGLVSNAPIDYSTLREAMRGANKDDFCNVLARELRKSILRPDGEVDRAAFSLGFADYRIQE